MKQLQNSPIETEQNISTKNNNRQSQNLLFKNVPSFIINGHKGEDQDIQADDQESVNLTENPLNAMDNSEIFRKSVKRSPSPRKPIKPQLFQNEQNNPENIFTKKSQNNILYQQNSQNKMEESLKYPLQMEDKLAQLSFNGCNYNSQTMGTGQLIKQQSKYLECQSPQLSIKYDHRKSNDANAISPLKESTFAQNRPRSITDFTNPKAKKRLTQVIKSQIVEQLQVKQQEDFEKGNKIIMKVLKNSLDRMQRIELQFKEFIYKILHNSQVRNLTHLKIEAYDLIKDKAFFFKQKQKQKQHSKFILLLNRIFKKTKRWSILKVFMPTSSYRLIWDAIQIIFTVLFLFFYSILIFFGQEIQTSQKPIQEFFQLALYLFIGDIVVNLNTAYFNKDLIVLDRKLIAKKYFKSLFVTDTICVIMLIFKIIFTSSNISPGVDDQFISQFKNALVFSKIFGLKQKSHMLQSVSALKDSQKHLLRLVNNILLVVLAAHIVSILWYQLALIEGYYNFQVTWITKIQIQNEDWYTKYIYSLYWSVTTMTTVGYGDISACNYIEALFVSIMMIFMSCVFAYSINNIGIILQAIERDTQELTDNVATIQRYLNRKNVNVELKSRIRHYLYFLAEEQKDRNKEIEDKVFNKLSNKLREEVTNEVNSRVLKKYLIFTKQFSNETINRIVMIMKEVLVSPNEIIFKENQVDDCALYLIENGIVEIQNQKQGSESSIVINTLTQNQLFGEISLFSGLSRTATARSVNLSTLYKISRQDLIDVLKQNDEDFQRFKMINEQIIFYKDYSSLGLECYTCKKQGHIASLCQLTHLNRDRQFVALKYSFSLFQPREKSERRKAKQKLVILNKKEYLEIKKRLFSDQSDDDDEEESSFETRYDGVNQYQDEEDDSNSFDKTSVTKSEFCNVEYILDDESFQEKNIIQQRSRMLNLDDIDRRNSELAVSRDLENSMIQSKNAQKKRQTIKQTSKETNKEPVKEILDELNEKQEKKLLNKINKKVNKKIDKLAQKVEIRLSLIENSSIQLPIEAVQSSRNNYKKRYTSKSERDTASIECHLIDQRKDSDLDINTKNLNITKTIDYDNNEHNISSINCADLDKRSDRSISTKSKNFNIRFSRIQNNDNNNNIFSEREDSKINRNNNKEKKSIIVNNLNDQYMQHLSPYQQVQQQGEKISQINSNQHNDYQYQQINQQLFQTQNDKEGNIMDNFDIQKEYSKFFPHNNLSKILDKLKFSLNQRKNKAKAQNMNKFNRIINDIKVVKAVRRLNLIVTEDYKHNLLIEYNPTCVAYGIGARANNNQLPVRKSQEKSIFDIA
ncbi:cyclic nucleotide-binding domain protein (macronuclear) [Tetrahymena thermophila SB210]|uniref:Cyclic nucleotide-binding domain protein n=1 Tax=Tetrahymena thermophila (strain SB210) TaxID=312017 RepID=Q231Q5_TETTS|nr:cyclic nucleotide-binding domain protein [Tetrahymena thermophila SB210]EAR91247.2 cyclic nucleotide-binding domain protein [Tetrahymena thermophila SB210]|eukprot:XP_001011492.2 cyclic nucleotide-binding domain protein [Tetrahymena thermophila SB210]